VTEASPAPADAAIARLREATARHGYPEGSADVLVRYVRAVLEESERVNLTGSRTLADALEVLALDALPVAAAWDGGRPPPRLSVDLGTGNGLPGAAVALRWPSCRTVLVERRAKKARAVERCLAAAGVRNAAVVACDGRELLRHRPDLRAATDLVTVRAVGDLAPTTKEAAPWVAPGGRVVHWKPAALDPAERSEGVVAARAAGLVPLPDVEFAVGERAGGRRLVVFERPR
jgi:16S rRNA G527 N7-methylase RsmG